MTSIEQGTKINDMTNSQATWRKVWAAVRTRQRELGWTDKQLYEECNISQTVYADGRKEGRPLMRADKIAGLERGLGWSAGSVGAILAGGAPTVEVPRIDEISRLAARVDETQAILRAMMSAMLTDRQRAAIAQEAAEALSQGRAPLREA